ncbi:putative methyltransferase YcgJ [Ruminiclostridium hungatei]|uniref:Putative methyltransferase YcgJ n=1 Tax=Ruminiclostridium hungatei TaxID=48256 RepID=A0A1V4SIB9_RUMHU|nr:class I SAM-dependent methyltransferase [Ruminiclostridium hungatei]OPX42987.1 putative methyltransferase YcgJ [Ruminiclostridium hungatei]
MGMEWYDMVAKKNGGYKSNAIFTVEGISGEDVFEKELIQLLRNSKSALDAGCGHGDFTIKMAKYAYGIVGFDWSIELLKIADSLKEHYKADNVNFVRAATKSELPFEDGQFDLVYCRRGPTSITKHSRILCPGGIIYGICPEYPDIIAILSERLSDNGFIDIQFNIFDDVICVFPNDREFAKFLTAFPGNPDYTLPENKPLIDEKVNENMINGRLCYRQWRIIWKAIKS